MKKQKLHYYNDAGGVKILLQADNTPAALIIPQGMDGKRLERWKKKLVNFFDL